MKTEPLQKINLTIVVLYRDVNNIHDSKQIEDTVLQLHENKEELQHAKDSELYNASIDDNKFIHSLVDNKKDVKFMKELKILKSESNLMIYDVKKFLEKNKVPEYINDPNKYLKSFIKQHKLNIVEPTK